MTGFVRPPEEKSTRGKAPLGELFLDAFDSSLILREKPEELCQISAFLQVRHSLLRKRILPVRVVKNYREFRLVVDQRKAWEFWGVQSSCLL